ncbi:hypothetical protein DSO57_1027049 [Entomophthora muscae]|uniref:Uncharacterized protein n=1 Tax=Entomophthora muscae TaxID=34485 RepID=A0ACC2UME0_9FUNG|nr:hypothetical protein DSO57_1027049 [Entomophthora muscae]
MEEFPDIRCKKPGHLSWDCKFPHKILVVGAEPKEEDYTEYANIEEDNENHKNILSSQDKEKSLASFVVLTPSSPPILLPSTNLFRNLTPCNPLRGTLKKNPS